MVYKLSKTKKELKELTKNKLRIHMLYGKLWETNYDYSLIIKLIKRLFLEYVYALAPKNMGKFVFLSPAFLKPNIGQ